MRQKSTRQSPCSKDTIADWQKTPAEQTSHCIKRRETSMPFLHYARVVKTSSIFVWQPFRHDADYKVKLQTFKEHACSHCEGLLWILQPSQRLPNASCRITRCQSHHLSNRPTKGTFRGPSALYFPATIGAQLTWVAQTYRLASHQTSRCQDPDC